MMKVTVAAIIIWWLILVVAFVGGVFIIAHFVSKFW